MGLIESDGTETRQAETRYKLTQLGKNIAL